MYTEVHDLHCRTLRWVSDLYQSTHRHTVLRQTGSYNYAGISRMLSSSYKLREAQFGTSRTTGLGVYSP